jgi:predicted metalloprotease with PDZ domain
LGMTVKADGTIQDVIPGMSAEQAGLSPFMKIIGVGGRQFSVEELSRAVENSHNATAPIAILSSNTGTIERHDISYRDGLREPHLKRNEATTDYLDEILKPLAK